MAEAPFPVEFVVLGLLARGPRHGYELKKEIEHELWPIWHIATSRLYLALARLERAGLIRGESRSTGGRARRVYRLTAAGEERLWEWLRSPVPALRDLRVEFLAKIYFLLELSPGEVPGLIAAEIEALERLRDKLQHEELPYAGSPIAECVRGFRLGQVDAALAWLRTLQGKFSEEVVR
ncbi:MAG: PadR family transcriptional regulator [Caldiserica bacterium]|nr:PadR family transcriptional regulator [Caldisericota bacterium]